MGDEHNQPGPSALDDTVDLHRVLAVYRRAYEEGAVSREELRTAKEGSEDHPAPELRLRYQAAVNQLQDELIGRAPLDGHLQGRSGQSRA